MTKITVISVLCAIVLVACGTQPNHSAIPVADQAQHVESTPSEAASELAMVVSADEQAAVDGINTLAFELYQKTAETEKENFIFSSYSVALAFSMIYAGAEGATKTEMAQVLHFLPSATQPQALHALDQRLRALASQNLTHNPGEETTPFQLNVVNALWGQQAYPFRQHYLNLLQQTYHANLQTVDFSRDATKIPPLINAWVAEQTMHKINDLIPPDALNPQTRLVLANAIYFNAAWMQPFPEAATQADGFTRLDTSEVRVPMMHKIWRAAYVADEQSQAIFLPYVGETVDMVIIVPKLAAFTRTEQQLGGDFLDQLSRRAALSDVTLTMPKFVDESDMNLKAVLQTMGLQTVFDEQTANFSGMTSEQNHLFLADAFHKSLITVDEKGTEAAAATAIPVEVSAFPAVELVINHPFVYAIRERATGLILFVGRVTNPQ